MDDQSLRSRQAPIKARYKEEPAAAFVTLRADGRVEQESLTCHVKTGTGVIAAGLHQGAGGDGLGACSGEMLLEALVACAGVTLSAVATALNVTLREAKVSAEGDLDFRGTLGVSKDVPIGIGSIRLRFQLDTDAGPDQVDTLVRLTERYCVIFQTLKFPPSVTVSRVVANGD